MRDYGVDGQLGLEPTFEEYIDKLCGIYDEVFRVLRPDGCCFVNLGDTYAGGGRGYEYWQPGDKQSTNPGSAVKCPKVEIPDKSLCLIPQRFAIEMINRGWILRNVIIWHKPNPMPSSAKDRFTVDFEYVFFFVKQQRYWFEPQYEPYQESSVGRYALAGQRDMEEFGALTDLNGWWSLPHQNPSHIYKAGQGSVKSRGQNVDHLCVGGNNPLGRNKRTVWTIPTQSFPDAHFATFPEKLVEPMMLSGCPEFVCKKCGQGRRKVYEAEKSNIRSHKLHKGKVKEAVDGNNPDYQVGGGFSRTGIQFEWQRTQVGYTDCGCKAGWRPGIVLDMFRWQLHGRQGSRKAG